MACYKNLGIHFVKIAKGNVRMTQKISSLEYKLRQILSGYGNEDLAKGFAPRTREEEERAANEGLREQLSSFKNADGSALDSQIVDSMAGKLS